MLSFGIDASRAFATAFWSARFEAGSGPPSRAATMIARVNFEKSWPRFASAAPFLCLIELHLLCPDMRLLFDEHGLHARNRSRALEGVAGCDRFAASPEQQCE